MSWFKKIFRSGPSGEVKATADLEMSQITEQVWPLYQANLRAYLSQIDLMQTIQLPYDYRQINDMFLWGMIANFLSGRPRLPTDAHTRIVLYMMHYFANAEGQPFEEGRLRAIAAKDLFEKTSPLFDTAVEAGAKAYQDGGDGHLVIVQAVAARSRG